MKNLHIRDINHHSFTFCNIEIKNIQCRPRYGHCNLRSGHKSNHDSSVSKLEDAIMLADDNDPDCDVCSTCLVNSY